MTSLRSLFSGEEGSDSACVIGDGRLPLVAIGVFCPSCWVRRSERRGFFFSSGLDSPWVPCVVLVEFGNMAGVLGRAELTLARFNCETSPRGAMIGGVELW